MADQPRTATLEDQRWQGPETNNLSDRLAAAHARVRARNLGVQTGALQPGENAMLEYGYAYSVGGGKSEASRLMHDIGLANSPASLAFIVRFLELEADLNLQSSLIINLSDAINRQNSELRTAIAALQSEIDALKKARPAKK